MFQNPVQENLFWEVPKIILWKSCSRNSEKLVLEDFRKGKISFKKNGCAVRSSWDVERKSLER